MNSHSKRGSGNDWNLVLTTDAFPEHERVSVFREKFSVPFAGVTFEKVGDAPFHGRVSIRAVGSLVCAEVDTSDLTFEYTKQRPREEEPFLIINAPLSRELQFWQGTQEWIAAPGGFALMRSDGCGGGASNGACLSFRIPCSSLAPLLPSHHELRAAPLHHNDPVASILSRYLTSLLHSPPSVQDGLDAIISRHIGDLIALGLGPSKDGLEEISQRGVRASRLRAIKDDVSSGFSAHDLSVQTIAVQHGITPRYVQMLFEGEGTTFSEFVLARRLEHAFELLTAPAHNNLKVADIALASGFSDISYFNRAFRRRYGDTPSGVRRASTSQERDDLK
jgi:AraC-like DNA-binding protein